MKRTKRNLVYHMWLPDTYTPEMEKALRIHLNCLSYYQEVFDTATFVIAYDKYDKEHVKELMGKITNAFHVSELTFKVRENTHTFESETFHDEIKEHLNDIDGLTFFAHSKGLLNGVRNWDNIYRWITSMYFLNLEYDSEVDYELTTCWSIAYGSFKMMVGESFPVLNGWIYNGAYYWINTKKLHMYNRTHYNVELPELCDRGYAEMFPGDMINDEWLGTSHNKVNLDINDSIDMYNEVDRAIGLILNADELNKYNEFHETILKST